jgi:probable rRNA maturation factor
MTEALTPAVVAVRNAQRSARVEVKALEKFANSALRKILALPSWANGGLTSLRHVDVVLISDRRMAQLHQRFMNIKGATDVLTFQHGEMFVSVETAARNARRFQTSRLHEIQLYLVHGLLHLHGFDDTTPALARAMNATQTRIMQELAPKS